MLSCHSSSEDTWRDQRVSGSKRPICACLCVRVPAGCLDPIKAVSRGHHGVSRGQPPRLPTGSSNSPSAGGSIQVVHLSNSASTSSVTSLRHTAAADWRCLDFCFSLGCFSFFKRFWGAAQLNQFVPRFCVHTHLHHRSLQSMRSPRASTARKWTRLVVFSSVNHQIGSLLGRNQTDPTEIYLE